MKTYKYRQIKININTEEPDNIKLLSILDSYNSWERNRMILETLIDKFVVSQPADKNIVMDSDYAFGGTDRNMVVYQEELKQLTKTVSMLYEKISVLDERMNHPDRNVEPAHDVRALQDKYEDGRAESKLLQKFDNPENPDEKPDEKADEVAEPELPAGVLDFLSAL